MGICQVIVLFVQALLANQARLAVENLALRQQLAGYYHTVKRPKLRTRDRVFWDWLVRWWSDWRSVLVIVQPATVVGWHRQGFRLHWRWMSRGGQNGRPRVDAEIRNLIRPMSRENPLWGAPHIQAELKLLGHDVAKSRVVKYMMRPRQPPSPTWRIFLNNHMRDLVGIDFFTIPTANFRILYCFLIFAHDRRRLVHFNVTAHPTAQWTGQQIVEACPLDEAPRFLIRDRDGTYGEAFRRRVESPGIEEVINAPRSPWQNPYAERVIGSIHRECLDHLIVLSEAHLKRILHAYFVYYHTARIRQSFDRNAPVPRRIELPDEVAIIAIPQVGGLHHRYTRVTA